MEITNWHSLRTIISLTGILGLTGYYRIFVKSCAGIVTPLTTLLKKYVFRWDNKSKECFKNILFSLSPISPNHLYLNVMHMELEWGLFSCWMSTSFRLKIRTKTKGADEIYIWQRDVGNHSFYVKWEKYLLGAKFLVKMDKNSLKYFLNQKILSLEQKNGW